MANSAVVGIPPEERVGLGRQTYEVVLAMSLALLVMLLANARVMAFAMVPAAGIAKLLTAYHFGDRRPARRWDRFRDTLMSALVMALTTLLFPANQAIFQGVRPLSTLLHRLGY